MPRAMPVPALAAMGDTCFMMGSVPRSAQSGFLTARGCAFLVRTGVSNAEILVHAVAAVSSTICMAVDAMGNVLILLMQKGGCACNALTPACIA